MADEEKETGGDEAIEGQVQGKSKVPLIITIVVVLLVLGAVGAVFMLKQGPQIEPEKVYVEYPIPERMYQLKDGSYLRLSFSILIPDTSLEAVKGIVETNSPARLPDGLNQITGNKSREDIINGAHKREAFAREIKKVLEEQVFNDFNRKQASPKDTIDVKDILFSVFVTQSG